MSLIMEEVRKNPETDANVFLAMLQPFAMKVVAGWLSVCMMTFHTLLLVQKQNENSLGDFESNIYRDSGIRTDVYVLFENEEKKTVRVVVIEIPSRPTGKVFKFEDVPLMRVGEDLLPMDDKTFLSIIQEQEPDFSEQFCDEATFDNLDTSAIAIMKKQYAKKHDNPSFTSLDDRQVLSDLHLIVGDKITNAAILLVGKEAFLNKVFPQAKVILEYRNTEAEIHFDNRMQFGQPFFILIDKL